MAVGSLPPCEEDSLRLSPPLPKEVLARADATHAKVEIILFVAEDGRPAGCLAAADPIRSSTAAVDVGIAMGTGTDVAIQSAGVTLVGGDLSGLLRARHLNRATIRNIRQNLFFAFVYNSLGVPLAAGILYPFFGLLLSLIIASAAMSLSSVSVIANALRLRRTAL